MNLENVAEQTDIAKGTLYHYFSGKDELVAAVLEALTSDVNSRLEARRTWFATAATSSSSVPLSASRSASSPRPHPKSSPCSRGHQSRSPRPAHETGFKWFVPGPVDGSVAFDA